MPPELAIARHSAFRGSHAVAVDGRGAARYYLPWGDRAQEQAGIIRPHYSNRSTSGCAARFRVVVVRVLRPARSTLRMANMITKFPFRVLVLASCLTVVACTDEQAASTPAASPASEAPAEPAQASAPAATVSSTTEALSDLPASALCALDSVNGAHASEGAFPVSGGQPVTFEGWVAMSNLQPPATLKIYLDGQADFAIGHVTGVLRKDVADAYGSPALETAGFKIALPTLDVPADRYSVVIAHEEAGATLACRTNLSLVVGP